MVYIREAHPAGAWEKPVNQAGDLIEDPETFDEREAVASTCVLNLKISIPCLIDDINDTAARAYLAFPDRMYVVGRDGRIAYTGDLGPFGFQPEPMEAALIEELKRNEAAD